MMRLPPILLYDYFRHRIWPLIKITVSLAVLAAIIVGMIP